MISKPLGRSVVVAAMLHLISTASVAQFNALPDSNATWMTSFWIGPGYPVEGWLYQYDPVQTDTVILGETYKKLLVNAGTSGSYYGGAIRDNEVGQVYYCEPWATDTELLYDFDVVAGDTIQDSYFGYFFVHAVDTILVNGSLRKRVELSCNSVTWSSGIYWIQGIGSNQGLLHCAVCGSVSGLGTLECMSENDTIQYGSGTGSVGSCDIYLAQAELVPEKGLSIHPNPIDDRIVVDVPTRSSVIADVINSEGRLVLSSVLTDGQLSVVSLSHGLYTLRATDSSGNQWCTRFVRR